MPIRTIIIDDERLARVELRKLLGDFSDIEIIDEAVNAEEALGKIESLQPELIFLDIQMPGKTGFELLTELDRSPDVIFTTAYHEYAIKAFEFNALDYLTKPVDPRRLADALQKLQGQDLRRSQTAMQVQTSSLSEHDQVFVKDGERCWFVKLSEIRLFESVGNYARVFFGPNKPLILKSLNAL